MWGGVRFHNMRSAFAYRSAAARSALRPSFSLTDALRLPTFFSVGRFAYGGGGGGDDDGRSATTTTDNLVLTGGSRTEERRGDTAGRSCRGEGGGMSGAPATERWRKAAARLVTAREAMRHSGGAAAACSVLAVAGLVS